MQKSPFKFLDSYSKEDRDIFFGRDKEIEEIHSRIYQSKILIVYGISGTGKSSLINCGLANKFNDTDWLPVNIRRGVNINQSLHEGLQRNLLTKISPEKSAGNSKNDIVKLIRSVYLDHFKPVFLIFDQCEEMFIFGSKTERDEFITTVKKITESDLQCRFIFSIREEYLAGFTEFERAIPSFFSNRIRIEKMSRQNAVKVIEGPCEINGIEVEHDLPGTLLEKLNPDSPDVELTYLQVYLDKIFRLASPDGTSVKKITTDLLDKVGDVKDLLGSFLEEQISRLDDPPTGLIILKSFVSIRGTKHQITEEEVIDYSKTLGKDIDNESVRSLIQKFIGLRILRDKDEDGRYELRHDSLASRIYEKITLVEKELLEVRQFIENSWRNHEKRNLFLTAEDLQYIAPYEDKLFLNEKITLFISQSKSEIRRVKRRRQNVLIAAVSIIFVVLSFFTVWAMKEKSNALDQKVFAEEQKDAAIKAKFAADSASREALISKNLAVEKESIAIDAQKQSEEARKEALKEREYALQQKNLAEKLTVTASEQARIANEEKNKAEQERTKAVAAEAKARQLGLLSIAQNLALKSINLEKDPQMKGILAVQAYTFNKDNGGQPDNPVIFEALSNSWLSVDSSRHSLLRGSDNETWSIAENKDGIIAADLDGHIHTWNSDSKIIGESMLGFQSPVNFISLNSSGQSVVSQHDNFDILLWKQNSGSDPKFTFQKLDYQQEFIRAVDFSSDGKYLATGGRDNQIIIWDIESVPAVKIKSFVNRSPIVSVIFINSDTIIFAGEDGSVILRNIKSDDLIPIYKSDTGKPLCLAWNKKEKILFAGCSDGSLFSFKDKFSVTSKYTGHTAGIEMIRFNSDFSLFATASRDRTIRLYFYNEFFNRGNTVGGSVHLKNINSRVRSMCFTSNNKLAAGLSDRMIYVWETSSEKLASDICTLIHRDLTSSEWNDIVGTDIPYEKCCQTKFLR